ncbi:MAG: acyltransferase domain-containing protein, partial [Kiritimatiellae bacterium]|nr:acyltransferase domain-containing protein [Kiritimatiellia bacterium]
MKTRLHIHDVLESELCLIGGADREELAANVTRLLAYLERAAQPELRDIALTTGLAARNALARAAVVATSTADLADKLRLLLRKFDAGRGRLAESKGVYLDTGICPAPGRTVFVFPGEGSQYPDMLRDLCLNFPACRSAFDDADTACAGARCAMLPSQWIFPTGVQPDTAVTEAFGLAGAVQAVLAADTALLRLCTQLGLVPDAVVGAGVGEIAALECAGVFAFETRADRLQALREGYGMMVEMTASSHLPACVCLAVTGLPRDSLEGCLAPYGADAMITRENSASQFYLCVRPAIAAGVTEAIARAGGNVRPLHLNHPYHTPWFAPAQPALTAFFAKWLKRPPRMPVYSCLHAAPHGDAPAELAADAAAQWTQPVNFVRTIERMYEDGFRVFVELGARGSLTDSIDSILQRRPHLALAANRGHRSGVLQLHYALAALAAHGQHIDVAPLHANRGSRLLDLARPRQQRPSRSERNLPLSTALPTLAAVAIPDALVAPAMPPPAGKRDGPPPPSSQTSAYDGRTDFPLLLDAEVAAETPGECVELVQSLSIMDLPILADSALGTHPVSLAERTLRGLPLMAIGMLAEAMAEAACRLAPDKVVAAIEDLRYSHWLMVEGSNRAVRIEARRLPPADDGSLRFETFVFDHEMARANNGDRIAQAIVRLADAYPPPPAIPRALALHGPVKLDWHVADIYPARLHHGPRIQSLTGVPQWGENGL